MHRLLLFICLLPGISITAFAQQGTRSHAQQFTTENGLPSNGIKGLQWDEKTGLLWIATEAGIVRFNGADFRSYTKENTPAITSERMLFMVRNNNGAIYTTDFTGNIFVIDQNKPVLWQKVKPGINPFFDNYYLVGVSDTFFRKPVAPGKAPVFNATITKTVCISDTSALVLINGYLYYHSISLQQPATLPFEKNSIINIFKTGNNYFVINNKKEFFLLNPANSKLTPVAITTENGRAFTPISASGRMYWETGMSTPVYVDSSNAWKFNFINNRIVVTLLFTSIPSDALIKSVQYSSRNNTLFIGTDSKGLIVLNETQVETKKRANGNTRNRNSYYSQIALPDGGILTNEGDIINSNTPGNPVLPVKGKFSAIISYTNDSLLWFNQQNAETGYASLHQYNKNTGITKIYDKIRPDNVVTAIGSTIYLANPRGVGVLDGDSMRFLYKYPRVPNGNLNFTMQEIRPGVLAIATCGGLVRFNTATNILDTIFLKENSCVRSIWKYGEYLFFGTYGSGFYVYKNGVVKAMPLDKNKYLQYTHCFVPDGRGYCWISTNRGLFKCSLAELVNVFDNNAASVYYHYFGKKDGMEMTELNGGCAPCALVLNTGTISFPTMDGLLWVDPEKAAPILPESDIFIDDIQVDGKKVNPDSFYNCVLPGNTQEIIIEPSFSAWCNKENIYLDYQLNDSVRWKTINTDNDAVIRLSNLSPGKYLLRIRKVNGFGINNFSYKELRFTISTPWHKQWWFYLLSFLAVMGVALLILRLRTRQYEIRQRRLEKQVAEKTNELQQKNEVLEKNNNINTRLISIISHDIVTPLKFLNSAGKNLLEKKSMMPEELKDETIKEITNTSKELQLLSTNILNWIKYQTENRRLLKETFNLHDLVNQSLSVLHSLARQKQIGLINETDKTLVIWQYFEPLKILIYNLVTNAVNFSEQGNIVISCRKVGIVLVLTVKDEGAGMTREQINNIMTGQFILSSANMDNRKGNGLGYLIIKDLLKTMGAYIYIKSTKGMGTTVYITMPAGGNNQ
jgi:signal transduction histidine kinase